MARTVSLLSCFQRINFSKKKLPTIHKRHPVVANQLCGRVGGTADDTVLVSGGGGSQEPHGHIGVRTTELAGPPPRNPEGPSGKVGGRAATERRSAVGTRHYTGVRAACRRHLQTSRSSKGRSGVPGGKTEESGHLPRARGPAQPRQACGAGGGGWRPLVWRDERGS